MTVLLTLRGLGDPTGEIVASFFNGSVAAGKTSVTDVPYVQTGLEGLMAAFGQVIPAEAQVTLDNAAAMLDDYLTGLTEPAVVMGHSLGALVCVTWLADYGPTSAVDPADVEFILVGNPARKYGGEFTVVGDRLDIPTLAIPEPTPYTVLDVTNQYDGWADWPSDLHSASVVPAIANVQAGVPTAHVTDYVTANLTDPGRTELTEGTITYRLLPTYPLPLLALTPEPLAGYMDAAIRPYIESAYDRSVLAPEPPPPPPPPPGGEPPLEYDYGDCEITDCAEPAHFCSVDGVLTPQPWMQWRQVGGVSAPSKTGDYGVTLSSGLGGGSLGGGVDVFGTLGALFGGLFSFIPGIFGQTSVLAQLPPEHSADGNKNELIHSLQTSFTNESPVDQWVYGLITRGGCRVSLQARSRGGLTLLSGYAEDESDPGPLTVASVVGVGADMGRAGTLALGGSFGVIEERMNSVTIPLAPERTGWYRLRPGATLTAKVELRFMSEFWENTSIDGGTSGAESSYETGDTRLDLFAVPVL